MPLDTRAGRLSLSRLIIVSLALHLLLMAAHTASFTQGIIPIILASGSDN